MFKYCHDIYATFEGADCVILMTEWNAYRNLDLKRIHDTMKGNVFVDLRNVYEPKDMAALGFEYWRWALEDIDVGFEQVRSLAEASVLKAGRELNESRNQWAVAERIEGHDVKIAADHRADADREPSPRR